MHFRVEFADGTIVDATVLQFARYDGVAGWPGEGDIAIVPPGHAYQNRYRAYAANGRLEPRK